MVTPTIVLYHDITPKPTSFESELNVTTHPEMFAAQLSYFERNYDFISLDELIEGPLPKRPLLLTFDDCYRSILQIAREFLSARGIPAVLFTNPELLAKSAPSLDNILSWYVSKYGIDSLTSELGLVNYCSVSQIISLEMSQRTSAERKMICDRLKQAGCMSSLDLDKRSPVLEAEDLLELIDLGVEIGNHTSSHVHCRSLTLEERQFELNQSQKKLEDITGKPVRAFSVPYGSETDLTPEVLSVLRQAGHKAIFLVHARSNLFRPSRDIWYRTSLHNEPTTILGYQLSIKPFLRSMKNMLKV